MRKKRKRPFKSAITGKRYISEAMMKCAERKVGKDPFAHVSPEQRMEWVQNSVTPEINAKRSATQKLNHKKNPTLQSKRAFKMYRDNPELRKVRSESMKKNRPAMENVYTNPEMAKIQGERVSTYKDGEQVIVYVDVPREKTVGVVHTDE